MKQIKQQIAFTAMTAIIFNMFKSMPKFKGVQDDIMLTKIFHTLKDKVAKRSAGGSNNAI